MSEEELNDLGKRAVNASNTAHKECIKQLEAFKAWAEAKHFLPWLFKFTADDIYNKGATNE